MVYEKMYSSNDDDNSGTTVKLPPSQRIRNRLEEAKHRYHSNDNIADFINDGELDELQQEVAGKLEEVLQSLVIDTERDHNTQDTANRVAKMFVRETFSGRYRSVPKVTAFPNMGYKSLYTTGPISIRSTCAHHFQNIVGRCWVGIVPENEVIGLSKFNRLVHHIAERPQIQEEAVVQLAVGHRVTFCKFVIAARNIVSAVRKLHRNFGRHS